MKKFIFYIASLSFIFSACSKTNNNTVSSQTSVMKETLSNEVSTNNTKETLSNKEEVDIKTFDEDGILTVGFDKDFPPMGFVDDKGNFIGFDLDLATEVAKRIGLKVKYQPIAWETKDMELNSGTIDVIWNGFSINGREDFYLFSEPYMENAQVFVTKKSSKILTLDNLKNKIVEVQTDSSAEEALRKNQELSMNFKELKLVSDYNTAFMDLEIGAVDAIALDEVVAAYQLEIRDNDDFIILDDSFAVEQYGIGFKKGNKKLRDKVQMALDTMIEDGTFKAISTKWFGKDVSIPTK